MRYVLPVLICSACVGHHAASGNAPMSSAASAESPLQGPMLLAQACTPTMSCFGRVVLLPNGEVAEAAAAEATAATAAATVTSTEKTTEKVKTTNKPKPACPPCNEPLPPSRVDDDHSHYPCPGAHVHYYVWEQDPNTCKCWVKDRLACL